MSSQSTADGNLQITVTFKLGTDLDMAQVLVQNRVVDRRAAAAGRGQADRRHGAQELARPADGHPSDARPTTRATSSTSRTTPRCRSATCCRASTALATSRSSARATTPCASGSIPTRWQSRNLTVGEVVAALQAQNIQVAAGRHQPAAGACPGAFQLNVETLGRLVDPQQFADIVVKADADGRLTRVARRRSGRARRRRLRRQRLSRRASRPCRFSSSSARLERARHRQAHPVRRWRGWRRIFRRACNTASSTTRPNSSPNPSQEVIKTIFDRHRCWW